MGQQAQRLYEDAIDRMSGQERVERALQLFDEFVAMLRHRISTENPGLDERELGFRVAEHLYGDEPAAMRLIAMAREHAGR